MPMKIFKNVYKVNFTLLMDYISEYEVNNCQTQRNTEEEY